MTSSPVPSPLFCTHSIKENIIISSQNDTLCCMTNGNIDPILYFKGRSHSTCLFSIVIKGEIERTLSSRSCSKKSSLNPFYRSNTNKRFSCSQLSHSTRRRCSKESLVFCLPLSSLPLLKVLLCGSKEEISLGFMKMNGGFSRYYVFAFKAAARDWSHTVFMERSR